MRYYFSLNRLANFLLIVVLGCLILYVGKFFFAPLAFSLLFAFMLKPLSDWLERWLHYRTLAILVSFLLALLPVVGILILFSWQISEVFSDLDDIGARLSQGLENIIIWWEERFSISFNQMREWATSSLDSLFDSGMGLLGSSLTSSTALLGGLVLTAIFTFFLLLYRQAFKNFILIQFQDTLREEVQEIMQAVQALTRQYLLGMLLVMGILGLLNSLGLWLIGIDYPIFWGFLAAFLAIIPYLGTTLGGTLPFIYSLATASSWWQPVAVVALYVTIQNIEGNFITPKVVGSKVNINPLAAIFSLFLGGALWGVSGLILALPILAGLKVTMQHIPRLQPLAELLDSHLLAQQESFFERYDSERFRLSRIFNRKEED